MIPLKELIEKESDFLASFPGKAESTLAQLFADENLNNYQTTTVSQAICVWGIVNQYAIEDSTPKYHNLCIVIDCVLRFSEEIDTYRVFKIEEFIRSK